MAFYLAGLAVLAALALWRWPLKRRGPRGPLWWLALPAAVLVTDAALMVLSEGPWIYEDAPAPLRQAFSFLSGPGRFAALGLAGLGVGLAGLRAQGHRLFALAAGGLLLLANPLNLLLIACGVFGQCI